MKRLGLVTLADLPELTGKGPTTSQITVARLGKYQDARYGKFEIAEADYEGWKRNLSSIFGGRVSVDFDHSSDRGRGTAAAGWITGLDRNGKDVIATVEWTPKGAKAIRNKSYQFISPTYTDHYKDETGTDRGRALLGAACTNRPVLRQLPTLSLSRQEIDGVAVATPRKRRKKERPMTKLSEQEFKTLSTSTDKAELTRLVSKASPKQLAKAARASGRALAAAGVTRMQGPALSTDKVITLAQFAPAGVQHAGTVDWDPPADSASRVPPGLDDAGKPLHALIAARATSAGQHYFHAMADVTGVPAYRDLSDIPAPLGEQQGLDPAQAAKYSNGRALAISAGINWMDAMGYLDYLADLSELQSDDGSASVPWLDSRPISPPRPWSDEDWERDQRRATAAGVDIAKPAWQAGAEQGRDVVGEAAEALRADAIATQQARGEGFLDQARAAEDNRRFSAINDELQRRATNRVAASRNGRAA
jgi:hypothetical protein